MPNIVEYTSKSELAPSDKGINAAVDAGRLYGQIGHQIGHDVGGALNKISDAVERHMAIMESSELYKTGTEFKLNTITKYEQQSALPENRGNPHFGDRFMAEIGPQIDAWGDGAKTEHGKMLAATLKASIRNEIFNHVASGQSEMDAAHVQDNLTQTMNMLGSGLITDPSEANLTKTLGTAKYAIDGMTMAIPDVGARENMASQFAERYMPNLVATRYGGVAESIKNQIAETGGDTSPALGQLNKDIKNQVGFQYLSPDMQIKISKLPDDAVRQGQELYNSKNATAKAQATEAGKAEYGQLHNVMTNLALAGQGPTPELIDQAAAYANKRSATNPGEVASLDDFILRARDRAQSNAVQPYSQATRDSIQAGFSLPTGDPRRSSLASLTKAYSHGQITKEDFSGFTEILNKLDKPETDPAFKPAWDAFVRWRDMQIQGIGSVNQPGTAAARAAFIHDSTASFMARGKGKDWDHALKGVTDPNIPGNFGGTIKAEYNKAANVQDAVGWLKSNWHTWDENGRASPLAYPTSHSGGKPAAPNHAPAPAPTPAADLKKADEIIWGKK